MERYSHMICFASIYIVFVMMALLLSVQTSYGTDSLSKDGDVVTCSLSNGQSEQMVTVTPEKDGEYVIVSSTLTGTSGDSLSAKLKDPKDNVTADGFARTGSRLVVWGDNNYLRGDNTYMLTLNSYGTVACSLMLVRYDGTARYHLFSDGTINLTEKNNTSTVEVICSMRPENEGKISWYSTDENVVKNTITSSSPLLINSMQEQYMFCWTAKLEGVQDGTAEIRLKDEGTGKVLASVPVSCTGFPVIPDHYGVYVGGVEVTSENCESVSGAADSGKVSYDPATNTLKLSSAEITYAGFTWLDSDFYPVAAIGGSGYGSHPLRIELSGKNVIHNVGYPSSAPSTGGYDQYGYEAALYYNGIEGIHVNGEVVFTGTGSLEIDDSSIIGAGIVCDQLTVDKGAALSVGISFPRFSYGVETTGTLTVNGGLSVNSYASNNDAYSIKAKNLIIGGSGSLTAKAGAGRGFDGQALIIGSTVTLRDGVVMKAGSSASDAYAVTPSSAISDSYVAAKKGLSVKIKPAAIISASAGKKKCTVRWSALSKPYADGYQISYSTSKKFAKKSTKTKLIKSVSTAKSTITKLKSKKTYYFRVRAYKTINGKKYYSSWSKSKKAKIK